MKNLHPGIVLLAAILIVVAVEGQLRTVHEWNYIDYVWPSESVRSKAIKDGAYNLTQIIPMDVDVAPDGRVFISMYNLGGVPARLGYVTKYAGSSGPLIQPYPNWGWTNDTNCNSIIEVIRIAIDECNRLWVLDTGSVNDQMRCDSKLLAFDLSTDELIEKVIIPRNISTNLRTNQSLLANVIVETSVENCEDRTEIVAQDSERLQYADGIKVIPPGTFNSEEELWVITNRYMRTFIKGRLNQTEINFRILKSSVRSLIAGTKCEIPFDISYSIPPRHPTLKWLLA
ncbi:hypothetical protein QAD02_022840 [Eretmocerus hayati]|uniref:Uncharacterized protein n=1 Tax=Eretmocerus hayati TaxID=131215 RepID=A0ACC2PVT5_9HYME|nr:hypothetical protein QAD02_022840 [Eretmocerus hayati]